MNLVFLAVTTNEHARLIYEFYRETGEPDAPSISFDSLSAEKKQLVLTRYNEINELVVDKAGNVLGFVTTTPYENGMNLGGAVLPQFRNQNIATEILVRKANALRQADPELTIFASTRTENKSAIRVIEKAGFVFLKKQEMPPLGRFTSPIEYSFFEFKRTHRAQL